MTVAAPPKPTLTEPGAAPLSLATPWMVVAGIASLGAGAVHFAAAGAHGEHKAAAVTFIALAVAQVAWGSWALVRSDRLVGLLGVVVGIGAVAGWALAKTEGLPFIPGLDVVEPVQFADTSAAVLAGLSTLAAAVAVGRRSVGLQVQSWAVVLLMTAFATAGSIATTGHSHAHSAAGHVHAATAYDPALPIDLSGTPGVTPRQQAAAENLVALTVARLPQWADAAVALRSGFHSIGDGFTGTEHLINTSFLDDGVTLDPDRPESLVYDTSKGGRTLVAAMYMLAPGTPLTKVPDLGGALVQWHVHNNLCFSPTGLIQGIVNAAGQCSRGQVNPTPTPMVHVWITKNACGPFAALEGIGGGQIAAGQTKLCDHLHGTGL
ncbi:MAG: hypothetical protein JWO12_1780 [Frankiales bacterium]|nr:hypothetical protein [Frankiales bacterium]